MIQKYREKSAEVLGWEIEIVGNRKYYSTQKNPNTSIREVWVPINSWRPDQDANQREMIEDWLIKQKLVIRYDISEFGTSAAIEKYEGDMMIGYYANNGVNESKSLAFMEAFMEYI